MSTHLKEPSSTPSPTIDLSKLPPYNPPAIVFESLGPDPSVVAPVNTAYVAGINKNVKN